MLEAEHEERPVVHDRAGHGGLHAVVFARRLIAAVVLVDQRGLGARIAAVEVRSRSLDLVRAALECQVHRRSGGVSD